MCDLNGLSRIVICEVGDLALATSPEQARGHWSLGRKIEVFPGKNKHVRVAKLLVGTDTMVRPITKLALYSRNYVSNLYTLTV